MLSVRLVAMIVAGHVAAFTAAEALYVRPPFQAMLSNATAIVDATVVKLLEHGEVRIKVHQVLKGGNPPLVLSSARLTCLGVDLSRRLTLGQRYVLLLHDARLYEETTFYEVRDADAGLECKCPNGSDRRWITISELRVLISGNQRQP